MDFLNKLFSKDVFYFFKEISNIPRCSFNEQKISDYIVNFAKERNLQYYQDELFNVVIKKEASSGYEKLPSIAIQGHLDMVCEKNHYIEHDFSLDPIKWIIKDNMIYADNTTLGADNGIAIAMALAILNSNDIMHPPLEAIFTAQEETGLTGARFLDKSAVDSRILINIDSEKEGQFLSGCAGGLKSCIKLPIKTTLIHNEFETYKLSISGLVGGHSGTQIHLGRGNALCILGRILNDIQRFLQFEIIDIAGGSKDNVIPREAYALVAISSGNHSILNNLVLEWNDILKQELMDKDDAICVKVESVESKTSEVLNIKSKKNLLYILNLHPNGVYTMSSQINGLVESSLNLGVLYIENYHIYFKSAVRSSVKTIKSDIEHKLRLLSAQTESVIYITDEYSEWKINPKSKIRDLFKDRYEYLFDSKPEITAVHMAVECGIFEEKFGDIDMISFGPDIYDIHSPDEHLSINSVDNCYKLLVDVLKNTLYFF